MINDNMYTYIYKVTHRVNAKYAIFCYKTLFRLDIILSRVSECLVSLVGNKYLNLSKCIYVHMIMMIIIIVIKIKILFNFYPVFHKYPFNYTIQLFYSTS